ncbi:hypothetical protein SAMN05216241_11147 [Limimonas halophila]|uniref:Uncharacterized protein n=1 Tax=Limimonas halophila TaxID=1082479 RepID=A0A1G7U1Y3_9PROT|nr:Ig-like domain-containing protein [Limimonas halophila]SDG41556.1 hypothetical protein SAMN05216241_11147 [Limimonas halophila]
MAPRTFTSLSDFERFVDPTRVIDFDDVDTAAEPRAQVAPDRYDGLNIDGQNGFYADEDFDFADDYVPVSGENTAAPAGSTTTVTFTNEAGAVSAFGAHFIDVDFSNLGESSLTAYDANGDEIASQTVPETESGESTFVGIQTFESATEEPIRNIAKVELTSGSGDPTVFENEGVVLDDFTLPAQDFQEDGGDNGAPVAEDDTATVTPGGSTTIDVLANDSDPDGDPLTVKIDAQPQVGAASVVDNQIKWEFDGAQPEAGTTVTLDYTVSDGNGGSDSAVVSVTPEASEEDGESEPVGLNVVALNGSEQTLRIPFDADVRGTGAAETIQAPAGADIQFGGGDGDRIEFAGNLADYTVTTSGNELVVGDSTTNAAISMNGDVEFAFADGSAAASIGLGSDGVEITLGGEAVGSGFDPSAVQMDAGDPSALAGSSGNTGGSGAGSSSQGLPALPADGGPSAVSSGTSASENIDGNQSGTIAGNGGEDRFIFAQSTTNVTISDFETGDQLFFQNGIGVGDIGIANTDFTDGSLELNAGEVSVTLTNLGSADSNIFDASSFTSQLGADALGFA